MRRALVVPFYYNGQPYLDQHKVLGELFARHAVRWLPYVDRLYVIDSGWKFERKTLQPLMGERFQYIERPPRSHWANLNDALYNYVHEPLVGILDNDTVIYRPEVIDQAFEWLNLYDAYGVLDGSGFADLSAYPIMAENKYRTERHRLCPYFGFFRRDALRPNFDFSAVENLYDSMGQITHQLLEDGKTIGESADDRSSVYIHDDDSIRTTQWLESPPKLWAAENPDVGYYHLRNFGGGTQLASTFYVNQKHHRELLASIPRSEGLRMLSWVWVACLKTGRSPHYLLPIVRRWVNLDVWYAYVEKIRTYYPWLEAL